MDIEASLNLLFVVGTLMVTLVLGVTKLKSLKNRLALAAIIIIPAIIFIYGFFVPESMFGRQAIQNFVSGYGAFAALALILLQILQVLIPPLDHQVVQFTGGFLFGPFYGFVYNYIGRVLGFILAFLVARRYGLPIVKKFVSKDELEKYGRLWDKNVLLVFLAYAFPFFPDDAMSYLAGLTNVKFKTFLIVAGLGIIGSVLPTTLAGTLMETPWFKNPSFWAFSIVYLLSGIAIFGTKRGRNLLGL